MRHCAPMLPYMLTEGEAAELLGMSQSNLRHRRRLRCNGKPEKSPTFVRMGRRIRYLSASVRKWGKSEGRYTGGYTPDHTAAGQLGIVLPRTVVLTDAQVCSVLRISARDSRDLRKAMESDPDGAPASYPPWSRENRSVIVRRAALCTWVRALAKRDECLDDALASRVSA